MFLGGYGVGVVMSRRAMIEQMNYDSDPRVEAGRGGTWYESFDESAMVAKIQIFDEDGDECGVMDVPVSFGVCGLCSGKGSHVNPSIDCGGLSSEDFADDPDFASDYFSGAHDVQCAECHGKRVVPEICWDVLSGLQREAVSRMDEVAADRAECEAEMAAERRMGA